MAVKAIRISVLLLCVLAAALAIVGSVAASPSPEIDVLHVDGTIVPSVASYIDRGITQAEENRASAVIIELSTPGGLLSTTEEIVDRILDTKQAGGEWKETLEQLLKRITKTKNSSLPQQGS